MNLWRDKFLTVAIAIESGSYPEKMDHVPRDGWHFLKQRGIESFPTLYLPSNALVHSSQLSKRRPLYIFEFIWVLAARDRKRASRREAREIRLATSQ